MRNHLRDEVGGHADNGKQGDGLQNPDNLESRTEGSIWSGHGAIIRGSARR